MRARRIVLAALWAVGVAVVWALCRAAAADAEDCGYASCPPPPSTGTTTTIATTTTTVPARIHGGLPITGSDVAGIVALALGLVAVGLIVLAARARARRP